MSDPPADGADDASTPHAPDERAALIQTWIVSRAELNAVEQMGVADADRWAFGRRREVLDEAFLRRLHRRMFGQVWRWAGAYRRTPRNIGVEAWRIEPELRSLLDDVRFWVGRETFAADEIAARFHHRLVLIHPFANGNGRLARLAADLLAARLGRPRFTWGGGDLAEPEALRQRYIAALRAADAHDIAPLMLFVRS